MTKPQAIMDLECYPNYFLVAFTRLADMKSVTFEQTLTQSLNVKGITDILRKYEIITFNGNSYDIPLLRLALTGTGLMELKRASDKIIDSRMSSYQFEKHFKLPGMAIDTIDLKEIAPSQCSLKMYAGRLHCERLQDLPYEPDRVLSEIEIIEVRDYCVNSDVPATYRLYQELEGEIELRRAMSKQYRCDLRSKSDAQIAETVIKGELTRMTGIRLNQPEVKEGSIFKYDSPEFIQYDDARLRNMHELVKASDFIVSHTGHIKMPKELDGYKIKLGRSVYRMGIGGLHSSEESVAHKADNDYLLADWDVTSYYPSIILNCRLAPEQLGEKFLTVYQSIVDSRIAAKREGDKVKDQSLKITINGSFGKLGSAYSALYAPKLMIQVTITGQLSLLMLIGMMEERGIHVVSANTDGIVCKCPRGREPAMIATIKEWEQRTGFNMERSDYTALYSRDVNNYIAIKPNGKVKSKGCFSTPGLKKNPQNEICNIAVAEFLKQGTPLLETVRGCEDVRKFLTVRKVNGGAVKGSDYLGKTIRWYYAKGERGDIRYKTNNYSVPKSYGARPLMTLTDGLPGDIDYDWYVREAEDMLVGLGVPVKGQLSLF